IVNALYARAAADRSIDLTFFSALTLEKPSRQASAKIRPVTYRMAFLPCMVRRCSAVTVDGEIIADECPPQMRYS
ncbi:MAG TPA: hypothetical protein VHJ00_14995, partial [Bradyrhizobium sp.]|nr:hypothetical protein [Bradyrhizobium sp.]